MLLFTPFYSFHPATPVCLLQKRGTGKAAFDESYKRYVHRVLQQTHPDLKISSLAMGVS